MEIGKKRKIILNKSEIANIWREYYKGLNREKIASKLGFTEWVVRKTLSGKCQSRYDRKQFQNARNEDKLDYEQIQLLLGTLLGDACLVSRRNTYSYTVTHCFEQQEYCYHIANLLKKQCREYIKHEGSYSAGKKYYKVNYDNKFALQKIANIIFKNGKKMVSVQWAEQLDELAIAYWFMDDGTSSWMGKSSVGVRFSTLSFNLSEINLLRRRLKDFGIKTTIQKHSDGMKRIISVKQDSVNKFFDLIEPHILPCFNYKIKRKPVSNENKNRKIS